TTGSAARAAYYLPDTGKGLRLYREFHRRPATAGVVRDAVTAMLTEKPADPDYTSLWPAGTSVLGARISGTTAYVDLSAQARKGQAGADGEAASLQQLVHTVTAAAPADVPPGSYVLRAFESSAEDGRPTFVDDKPLTVT